MSSPLIVAALKDEIRNFLEEIGIDCTVHLKPATLYSGRFLNRSISLLVTGLGDKRASNALQKTLHFQTPSSILFVGYAGGTNPVAPLASLVLANRVIGLGKEELLQSDATLIEKAKEVCEENHLEHQLGGLLTVDHIVVSAHEKADLGVTQNVLALDMEAYAVASLSESQKIPWCVVKSILDPVEMTLPRLQDCVDVEGSPSPLGLFKHLLKEPKDCIDLPKLRFNANQARAALTSFLKAWVIQTP